MRAVIQRVIRAKCEVGERIVGSIDRGVVVFLGVKREDELVDAENLAEKIINIRIFPDQKGKMNLSLLQVEGGLLIIPQFTLYANCRKGLRPNFIAAAPPEVAQQYYLKFLDLIRGRIDNVETGQFGAKMRVLVENDGPVTIILDS